MPRPRAVHLEILSSQRWVEDLDDACLQQIVTEALVARHYAVKAGAVGRGSSAYRRKLVEIADRILDDLRLSRVEPGWPSWKKGTDAIRRYVSAAHGRTRRAG